MKFAITGIRTSVLLDRGDMVHPEYDEKEKIMKYQLFDSQDHQGVMHSLDTERVVNEISENGTIEGEAIDALFELKKSHPQYAQIHTHEADGTAISPPPVVTSGDIDAHYFVTFSREETSDWISGMYPTSDGWTSHSNMLWRKVPSNFVKLDDASIAEGYRESTSGEGAYYFAEIGCYKCDGLLGGVSGDKPEEFMKELRSIRAEKALCAYCG